MQNFVNFFLIFKFLVTARVGTTKHRHTNFIKIGQMVAKISHLTRGKFWDDPQREFDGLYHCAKFGAIALVVLIIQKFEYFAHLA